MKSNLKAMERILKKLAHLLVIGGSSLDTLHLNGQMVTSAGGAGMYTTMAAIRSGVEASMFAPKPEPMPAELETVSFNLLEWIGPVISADQLPHFEIEYGEGKTNYLKTFIGAEGELTTDQLMVDLGNYNIIHLTPLGDSKRQLTFLKAIRNQGGKLVSAGTYKCIIKDNPESVREVINNSDIFFMNEEEAVLLYGSLENVKTSLGKLIFVTLGAKGAMVVQGESQTRLTTKQVEPVDPTGAGDTFCGATLAELMLGGHPIMAAYKGMVLASKEIQSIGPAALFKAESASDISLDERVKLNPEQIEKVSGVVKIFDEASPSNFTGKDFPPEGNDATLDYFFATILQQFSFWEAKNGKYNHPLIALLDGDTLKGSAYLFRAFRRVLDKDPEFYTPHRQAVLTREDITQLFKADDGTDPMPALDLHLELARDYGRDMLAFQKTPRSILQEVQKSATPLQALLYQLDKIGGYKEDPLRKKSNLLALVLNQRPEGFLKFGVGENVPPVIDYHTMRACLRMGLVEITDERLKHKIAARLLVTEEEEWAVRYACFHAVEEVVKVSGKTLGAVDWFFFAYARQHCPEMTEPICSDCAVNEVCTHRKELFQPVLRTTFY